MASPFGYRHGQHKRVIKLCQRSHSSGEAAPLTSLRRQPAGDGDGALERALADPAAELATELWMATHLGLRNTARVRAPAIPPPTASKNAPPVHLEQ